MPDIWDLQAALKAEITVLSIMQAVITDWRGESVLQSSSLSLPLCGDDLVDLAASLFVGVATLMVSAPRACCFLCTQSRDV